ncbi:hypothetical protein T484DRAFT_1941079 [Baffinella frigidus]|nr:hypothetical protein T484DRAFT_1941079 [Cryptophyta sp. CCMP2293]|mmetsp:Transcript_45007/g.107251  ORF Transcript_45007/g.107251 Transcript_45007/m.107251 type:complete len:202 (+) Transcript_45007:146-751(+)
MTWIVFPRKTITDTLRFPLPAAAIPAPNVKAAALNAPPMDVPTSPLAARRSKQPPSLNIATFPTANSLAHGQFRVQRHSPLAPAQQLIQSAQEEQKDWAALVIEQAASMSAPLAGWLEQLECPTPAAKAIAYTDAIQARAKQDLYKDAAITPGPIVPYRPSSPRQSQGKGSKGIPVFIRRAASAPDPFRPAPPTVLLKPFY